MIPNQPYTRIKTTISRTKNGLNYEIITKYHTQTSHLYLPYSFKVKQLPWIRKINPQKDEILQFGNGYRWNLVNVEQRDDTSVQCRGEGTVGGKLNQPELVQAAKDFCACAVVSFLGNWIYFLKELIIKGIQFRYYCIQLIIFLTIELKLIAI